MKASTALSEAQNAESREGKPQPEGPRTGQDRVEYAVYGAALAISIALWFLAVRAPLDLDEKIKQIAESVANVKNCHAVRIRCAGPETFIDAHLVLEGNMPLSEAHRITDLVEEAIRKEIPGADITVHAEPLAEPPPAAADIRAR